MCVLLLIGMFVHLSLNLGTVLFDADTALLFCLLLCGILCCKNCLYMYIHMLVYATVKGDII